ncbi:MAG: amidohydrolase [Phycisphaerae bacterium]
MQSGDLAIIGARLWGVDDARRGATALLVRNGVIESIGSDAEILAARPRGMATIDAGGRSVIPGIVDSHIHLIPGGLLLSQLDLRATPSRVAFMDAIIACAGALQPGEWLLGGNWSTESWPDVSPPRRDWIDAQTPNTPIYLTRTDLHQAFVNSAALALAGIDRHGPRDPDGGEIERDSATGEPTGILKDAAMQLVAARIPTPTEAQIDAALTDSMRYLNRFGITGAHDMALPAHAAAYARAHAAGRLSLRIHAYWMQPDWDACHNDVRHFPVHDDWLRIAGFKAFMDGSLGSRTALMREPYADATDSSRHPRGLPMDEAHPWQKLAGKVDRADAAGFQCAVHAIGDEANHQLLNAYATIGLERVAARQHRVEHAQHLLREDIVRFAQLGVIVSMQPLHKHDDGFWADAAIGTERAKSTYAFRTLLESGARLIFGSDWPVASPDPWSAMRTAVTGIVADGRMWQPQESISFDAAMRAYTRAPALVEGAGASRGFTGIGALADLAIVTHDLSAVVATQLADVRVTHTIVCGAVVYEAQSP